MPRLEDVCVHACVFLDGRESKKYQQGSPPPPDEEGLTGEGGIY